MASEGFFLGVDAGATRCRARLRDATGRALAETEGPAANIYVDFDSALAAMRGLLARTQALAGLPGDRQDNIALGLGIAGLSGESDARRVAAALPGWARVHPANDAVAACVGAHAGADGGLIIVGTGTAGIARVAGRETIVGGRGFLLGDDGAGARAGADAVRAALRAHDGLGPASPLTNMILARFGGDPNAMTHWALTAKPGDYGAFAPLVLEAADAGDSVAAPIVAEAARAIAALIAAVTALGAPRVAMVGGFGGAMRRHLSAELASALVQPLHDPIDGAVLLAGGVVARSRN